MELNPIKNPELIIGLVGPIGVDLETITNDLNDALKKVNYRTKHIHLTKTMRELFSTLTISDESYLSKYNSLIKCADTLREATENKAAMAHLAVLAIQQLRKEENQKTNEPLLGCAYIIRQFKREEEIALMRQTYGRKFIQVSVFLDNEARRSEIMKKIKTFNTEIIEDAIAEQQAIQLIEKDNYDNKQEFGQRIIDAFPLADVFVKGIKSTETTQTVNRFVQALFGSNEISPTKIEYGMYTATAASLRSIDLSRQVGAAIFSDKGEIITQGCNEVPKAFGGTYWCDDPAPPHRDFEEGTDGNHARKIRIVHDLVDRLKMEGYLSEVFKDSQQTGQIVQKLLNNKRIKESRVMDLIEFGRIIHAEMSAITDAARLGKSLINSVMFCTTFPCHMCAKHIVASGIKRVIYIEPYPKSHAKDLHNDSITFSPNEQEQKVLFEPFIGISPRRYRDIFEKKKRKDKQGNAIHWYQKVPTPLIEDKSSAYLENEVPLVAFLAPAQQKIKKMDVN